MSANQTNVEESNGLKTFSFTNEIPIPGYLVAMAIGNIAFKKIGQRTGVYTEPEMMDEVSDCLSNLESIVDKAEESVIPYVWGVYNVLILPPSFPYGGMENPLLTFASPTIITKDKS